MSGWDPARLYASTVKVPPLSRAAHVTLLCLFAVFVAAMIMLPILLIGFPYKLPLTVLQAKEFAESGIIPNLKMRLLIPLFASLSPVVGWDNVLGWTFVGALSFAAVLLPWWCLVCRVFDTRIAWIATVLLAFLPLYWLEAIELGGYPQGLFFLFLGSILFLELRHRHRLAAIGLAGLCFGFMVASRDAFLPFLPWFIVVYAWSERRHWKHVLMASMLFTVAVYAAFTVFRLPNVLRQQSTFSARVAMLVMPPAPETGEEHLYPDEYTYNYLREEYDDVIREKSKDLSFLERQQDAYLRIIFGLEKPGFFGSVGNSVWLFLNAQSSLFYDEMMGGVLLWLFIAPGLVVLWFTRRFLFVSLVGLYLAMEFQIRFFLHFGRSHLNDSGWIFVLFAAVGISAIVTLVQKHRKSVPWAVIAMFIVVIVSGHLLQANRRSLARLYQRSVVPMTYVATEAMKTLSANAIIAHPRQYELFYFTPQRNVSINTPTIDYLSPLDRLREPFERMGITHIIGYNAEYQTLIRTAVPSVKVLALPEKAPPVPLTPTVRYLLNLLR
jgi:hypothetical protein